MSGRQTGHPPSWQPTCSGLLLRAAPPPGRPALPGWRSAGRCRSGRPLLAQHPAGSAQPAPAAANGPEVQWPDAGKRRTAAAQLGRSTAVEAGGDNPPGALRQALHPQTPPGAPQRAAGFRRPLARRRQQGMGLGRLCRTRAGCWRSQLLRHQPQHQCGTAGPARMPQSTQASQSVGRRDSGATA